MCVKGPSVWEKGTHRAAGAEQPTYVTDVGVEGSAHDIVVRVLRHVAPLSFIESNGQTAAGLEAPNPRYPHVWISWYHFSILSQNCIAEAVGFT